jgi:hypothetical protein
VKSHFLLPYCFLALLSISALAQPTDNPYRTYFQPPVMHWTDSLKWNNVTLATSVGILPDDNQDDSAAVHAAINVVHLAGGGVIYFPPGIYNFSGNIKLKSGVILRGADLTGITDARVSGFNPATKFVFPKYIFDTLANDGKGHPNSTAFKGIVNEYDCRNFGLVNLDINRAFISFHPDYNTSPEPPHTTPQPIQRNRNIIVMGIRSNNAAIPDPNIPVIATPQRQRLWQRYCWRFTANVDIAAAANVVVANCRANGEPDLDETFEQPNYVYNRRGTDLWLRNEDGYRTRFDYTEHYGISVNRKKKKLTDAGVYAIYGVATYANPINEPALFAPGIEILNNYVWHSSRVAYMGAGTGLVMKGNISDMDPIKETIEQRLVATTGRVSLQGATTLENRGLDFSGWDCRIEDNKLRVYRDKVGGYLTTDGEGILVQECCGGTSVNDYHITRNDINAYIGIYKMRDVNNVYIRDNVFTNTNTIYVDANTNNAPYFISNTRVIGNKNASITVRGSLGGINCLVDSNTSTLTPRNINVSCHVVVGEENTNFIMPFTIHNNGGAPCLEEANYPVVKLLNPADSITFDFTPNQTFTVRAKLTSGVPASNTMSVFVNGVPVAENISFSPTDSMATANINIPNEGNFIWSVVAQSVQAPVPGINSTLTVFSPAIKFQRATLTQKAQAEMLRSNVKVYPNPAMDKINIAHLSGTAAVEILNLHGKKLYLQTMHIDGGIDIQNLTPGMYLVKINKAEGSTQTVRIVKK